MRDAFNVWSPGEETDDLPFSCYAFDVEEAFNTFEEEDEDDDFFEFS